jgi:hypothetical protein
LLVASRHKLNERAAMGEVRIIGVDLAKTVLRLHGATADGPAVFERTLPWVQFVRFATSRD